MEEVEIQITKELAQLLAEHEATSRAYMRATLCAHGYVVGQVVALNGTALKVLVPKVGGDQ